MHRLHAGARGVTEHGEGHLSLSTPPQSAFYSSGQGDSVAVTTTRAVRNWWDTRVGPALCFQHRGCHKSLFCFKSYVFPSIRIQPTLNNAVGRITEHGTSQLTARANSFLSLSLTLATNQASFFRQLKSLPFHAEVSGPPAAILYPLSLNWSLFD